MATVGLTSVGAMVTPGHGLWADAASELDLMVAAAPELAITMNAMVMTTDVDELEDAKDRIDRGGRRLRFLGVKVITDGSLGGRTAAMDDGYTDKPQERGLFRVTREETLEVARRSIALGGVVAIHANRGCRQRIHARYLREAARRGCARRLAPHRTRIGAARVRSRPHR